MRKKWMRAEFALLITVSVLVGCVASQESRMTSMERRNGQVIAALEKSSDADSFAAAGLLSSAQDRGSSLALIERATTVAPDRADLLWLQIQACDKTRSCDSIPLENRLRVLDAANGAGWLGELSRADAAKNDEARDAALVAISRSALVDIYWTTLVGRLSRAVAQTKTVSVREAVEWVTGYLAAQAIPGYGVISSSCKGERLKRAGIIEVCRGIARSLQQGDTDITEMLGVAIAERVWPNDSPEWQAAARARRVYAYRAHLSGELTNRMTCSDARMEQYIALLAANHREQDVWKAQIIAAGKPPDPPAD